MIISHINVLPIVFVGGCQMKTRINFQTRLSAAILSLILIINNIPFYISAAADTMQDGDSLNGWSVGTFWDKNTECG